MLNHLFGILMDYVNHWVGVWICSKNKKLHFHLKFDTFSLQVNKDAHTLKGKEFPLYVV